MVKYYSDNTGENSLIVSTDFWGKEVREIGSLNDIIPLNMFVEDRYLYFPSFRLETKIPAVLRLDLSTLDVTDTTCRTIPFYVNPGFSLTKSYMFYYHSEFITEAGNWDKMISALNRKNNSTETIHIYNLSFYRAEHEDSVIVSINGSRIQYCVLERIDESPTRVVYSFDFFSPERYEKIILPTANKGTRFLGSFTGSVYLDDIIFYASDDESLYAYVNGKNVRVLDYSEFPRIHNFHIFKSNPGYLIFVDFGSADYANMYKLVLPNKKGVDVYDISLT